MDDTHPIYADLREQVIDYLGYLLADGKADNTVSAYRGDLVKLIEWVDGRDFVMLRKDMHAVLDPIGQRDLLDYVRFVKAQDIAIATMSRRMSSLKSFYRWARETGAVTVDHAEMFSMPYLEASRQPPLNVTPEQFYALRVYLLGATERRFSALRDLAMIRVAMHGGLTSSELTKLRVRDLHVYDGAEGLAIDLKVGRYAGRNRRVVRIDDRDALQDLLAYLTVRVEVYAADSEEFSDLLFVGSHQPSFSRAAAAQRLKVHCEVLRITPRLTITHFRNAYILNQIGAGCDLAKLTVQLGMTNKWRLQRYVEEFERQKQQHVAEAV